METIQTTGATRVEVISAYAANNQLLPAIAAAPGWYIVGAFYLPASAPVKLELVGEVSVAGVTMTGRLFDVTEVEAVGGSTVTNTSLVTERGVSGRFDVVGGHLYQIQVQVVASSPSDKFAVVRTASLIT